MNDDTDRSGRAAGRPDAEPGSLDGPNVPLPEGRTDFDLPLGPLLVRVEGLPIPRAPFVPEHYDPFVLDVSPAARPDLTVRCVEGEGVVVPLPPPGGETEMEIEPERPGVFRIRSHWQDGFVDVGKGLAELTLTSRGYIPLRMSLENFLRAASQLMLVERGAFLLHGAGILDGERCFVLFGPSGAGKSTATELSRPRRALSDDIVLIDVSGAEPLAHAVPFFGAYPPSERTRGAWPVAALGRLRQHAEDRLAPLPVARSVATVSASVPFVHEFGVPSDRLTEVVARLCEARPVYDLYFTKSGHFWELLANVG